MTVFRSLERLNPYGALSLLFLLIGITTVFLPNEPLKDEQFYLPLIQVFGVNYLPSIDLIKTMDQSMGPLYFIFYGFIGQLTDYSIPLLRIVNVIVSFLTAIVLFKTLRQFCRYPLCLSLWFVVNPYFLLLTTPLLYTDNLCMLFVLLGMYFYLVKRNLFFRFAVGFGIMDAANSHNNSPSRSSNRVLPNTGEVILEDSCARPLSNTVCGFHFLGYSLGFQSDVTKHRA